MHVLAQLVVGVSVEEVKSKECSVETLGINTDQHINVEQVTFAIKESNVEMRKKCEDYLGKLRRDVVKCDKDFFDIQ